MASGAPDGETGGDSPVSVTTEIEDDRTIVAVTGDREVAIVVNSASGERVYLPPERESDDEADPYRPAEGGDSPYEGVQNDNPYEGIQDDSPYGSRPQPEASLGVNLTANGFRVVHPEPAEDVRFLR